MKPKRRSKRHRHLSKRTTRLLGFIPGLTLIAAYLTLVTIPSTDLASWEPFHAYLIGIAGLGAWVLAIVSLTFAAFIPMAYCRFGCPTGRLIDYLRRSASSHRLQLADWAALFTLLLGLSIRWING